MPGVVVLLLPVDYAAPYGRRPYGFALPAFSFHEKKSFSLINPYCIRATLTKLSLDAVMADQLTSDWVRTDRAFLKREAERIKVGSHERTTAQWSVVSGMIVECVTV